MDSSWLGAVLAIGTLGAVMIFAFLSIRRIGERRRSEGKKSTLAEDEFNTTTPGEKPADT